MINPPIDPAKDKLIDAILPHVAFDGWAPAAFNAAVAETGIDPGHAKTLCGDGCGASRC
jgi:ubiquinone biosynthesis protein COQ9